MTPAPREIPEGDTQHGTRNNKVWKQCVILLSAETPGSPADGALLAAKLGLFQAQNLNGVSPDCTIRFGEQNTLV